LGRFGIGNGRLAGLLSFSMKSKSGLGLLGCISIILSAITLKL
jgi:hypothetical protein